MSKSVKRTLIIVGICAAAVLLLAVLFLGARFFGFVTFGAKPVETRILPVDDDFQSISIEVDTLDIGFAISPDGSCRVECTAYDADDYVARVTHGTLSIEARDALRWHIHIGFFAEPESLTLYLPRDAYDSLEVETATGAITLGAIDFREIELSTDTGAITLADIACHDLSLESSTGNITLQDVIASGAFEAETSTGNVRFTDCDAKMTEIETSTGNITGTFLTPKTFDAHSGTGRVRIPPDESGDPCTLRSGTGNIHVEIA